MPRRTVVTFAISGIILFTLAGMIQPSYFFANPSRYSLFSAIVADRGVDVQRGIAFGDHPRLKIDIYSPETQRGGSNAPIVLFLYGGTWKEGDRAIYGFVGAALAARGITTLIPDYRLFPDVMFPAFIEDAAQAYVWTQRRFADTSQPIIVMGHSAGAHMAAMLALNPSYIRNLDAETPLPAGLVGLAGPYAFDLTDYPTTHDLFAANQSAAATIPSNFATEDAPPALLIHGSSDKTVKLWNQETLATKLRALNVPVETHVAEGVDHVGIIRNLAWPFRNHSPAIDLIVHFVQKRGQSSTE